MRLTISALLLLMAVAPITLLSGCGASAPLQAKMAPLNLTAAPRTAPQPLKKNHFQARDRSHVITEEHLREVLAAPVFLEAKARVGVIPVSTGYGLDKDLPLVGVPDSVSGALQDAGLFEVATEVSTDWPTSSGIPGLRELAARYRCEYLLLYRHRFVDREWTNGWGAMWLTVVGGFFAPMNSMETAGVLEATLFDVKTGTLLFTVYERVNERVDENIYQNDRKRRELKERLLDAAAKTLANRVVEKTRVLANARPVAPTTAPTSEHAQDDPPSGPPQAASEPSTTPRS